MAENPEKVTVTYDSIFEMLMREKGRDELQKLSPGFLQRPAAVHG